MNDKIETLILVASYALEDNKIEKEDLLVHYFRLSALFTHKFSNNTNLSNALNFIQNVLSYYISESELEYQFYSKALAYLNNVYEHSEERSQSVLDALDEQINVLEELYITRTASIANVVNYFYCLIANNILTDKNYFVANISNRIDEEEKARILGVIPGVENGI